MVRLRRAVLLFVLALPCVACAATPESLQPNIVPTGIQVDPLQFLGTIECSREPGAMQSYVATLVDVTISPGLDTPFTLASSPPTPCSEPIDFRFVLEGHEYIAFVDGYTAASTTLTPFGGADSGSEHMQDILSGAFIEPRWTTQCGGNPSNPAIVTVDMDVVVQNCDPMNDLGPATPTGVAVDPTATLGSLSCGPGAAVGSFDVTPLDMTLPAEHAIACTEPTSTLATYTTGITAGVEYRFVVEAHDGTDPGVIVGSAPCFVTAKPGVISIATCDPLGTAP